MEFAKLWRQTKMKTVQMRINKQTLAVMKKQLPKRRDETNAQYIRRYVEEMQAAERQQEIYENRTFCN